MGRARTPPVPAATRGAGARMLRRAQMEARMDYRDDRTIRRFLGENLFTGTGVMLAALAGFALLGTVATMILR